MFLIIYEMKKNKLILNIANGFSWGVLIHILIDLAAGVGKTDIFWPLPIGALNGWSYNSYKYIILGLDFLFFRLLASELIKMLLNNPIKAKNINFIKPLIFWMKYQVYIFILFLFFVYFKKDYTLIIFGLLYIPSYLMSLLSIYKVRDCIE